MYVGQNNGEHMMENSYAMTAAFSCPVPYVPSTNLRHLAIITEFIEKEKKFDKCSDDVRHLSKVACLSVCLSFQRFLKYGCIQTVPT